MSPAPSTNGAPGRRAFAWLRSAFELLKTTYNEWTNDKAPQLGTALAYYTVFSIAPLLIIAIAMASLVYEGKAADAILDQINDISGLEKKDVQFILAQTQDRERSGLAMVIGLAVLLFGASGAFAQLQDALNAIWKVKPKPDRGLFDIVRERFLSFTLVLGTGFLLLVSLILSAGLAFLGKYLTPASLPGGTYLWQAVNALVSLAFITLLFALMYKVIPDAKIAWADVWIGAFVTALLFTAGKHVIGAYLGRSGTASAFGAAGSLVVVLLWVYYSSQILLFGAEFTRVYACRHGAPIVPADSATSVESKSGDDKETREAADPCRVTS